MSDFTTDWQYVGKGIITGCTISVILFALVMTMLKQQRLNTEAQQRNLELENLQKLHSWMISQSVGVHWEPD